MSQVQQAKADRKLYIGNLPTGITNQQLMQNLNQTLVSLKANLQPGGPITTAWISSDGNYAFIEFRTPEEANEGFVLNDLTVLGKPLKVGRPHTYPSNGASGMLSTMANPNLTRLLQPGNWANSADIERHRLMGGRISHDIIKLMMPTPVLQLHNLLSDPLEELEDQDNYQDLLEDVRDECARFGRVKLILIPKLSDYPPLKREYEMRKAMAIEDYNTRQEYLKHAQSEFEKPKKKRKKHHHHKAPRREPTNKEPVVPVDGFLRKNADCEITIEPRRKKKDLFLETDLGIGKIFVEFDNEVEAAQARSALDGRKFGTNIVTATFFPPQLFKQRRLGPPLHDIENLQKQWEEKLQLMALEEEAKKREQEENNLQAVPLGTNNEILNALFEMPNPVNNRATGFMMGGPP